MTELLIFTLKSCYLCVLSPSEGHHWYTHVIVGLTDVGLTDVGDGRMFDGRRFRG